jgi:hypothetical protein
MYKSVFSLSLVLALVLIPLAAMAVVNHYTHFVYPTNTFGQGVIIKTTPGVLHTVTINNNQPTCGAPTGCFALLLDTNSPANCTNASPPTAPVIANIAIAGLSTDFPFTLTYDLTTKSGLCFVYEAGDITVTWN